MKSIIATVTFEYYASLETDCEEWDVKCSISKPSYIKRYNLAEYIMAPKGK